MHIHTRLGLIAHAASSVIASRDLLLNTNRDDIAHENLRCDLALQSANAEAGLRPEGEKCEQDS